MTKIKKIIAESISRYPHPAAEAEFIAAHKIELFDFGNPEPNPFTRVHDTHRQNTRPADIAPGEDVEKYLGASDLEKILAKYPVEDIETYIARRNSGNIAYQDSRDEKLATSVKSPVIKTVQDKILRDRHLRSVYESVSEGNYKLKDGSSVKVSKQDADLLRKMLKELSTKNKAKMENVMNADKAGFEEILSFAREAL